MITIHIRTPKKHGVSHAHKRAKAHRHTHEHDHERKQHIVQELKVTQPVVTPPIASVAPTCVVVPKKPAVIADIPLSAYAVAYFCMEIALAPQIPTYSGGLGILAGDMLRSAADLKLSTIGVTLLYRGGYFRQRFDESGWQMEEAEVWDPRTQLIPLENEVQVNIEGRDVVVRAWLYKVRGVSGHENPVLLLDTDVPANSPEDRRITERLYQGDKRMRLMQEAILSIGGMRMLEKIGATNIHKFHMNEGHSALLTLELYRLYASCGDPIEEVRRRAVFTTHTPVAAGHDRFPEDLVLRTLGVHYIPRAIEHLVFQSGELNMTRLGFNFSQYINGVAKKHGETSRELFPGYSIESITNGVHAETWTSPYVAKLYDKYLPGWRIDPYNLRYALSIPTEELWEAHQESKRHLCEFVALSTRVKLDPEVFTIGFARRSTGYKRGYLLFSDMERLRRIAERGKGIQIVYAGKAHPDDREGKLMTQDIIRKMRELGGKVTCVYLENYNMELAKLLVSGVDLWLNTPARPLEASGTSGMKAALNGVPQFSTLDGWWLEGHIEGVTGWSIGEHPEGGVRDDADQRDVEDLYMKLEYVIIPRFENERHTWTKMMRSAAAINGSFFNTHRMVEQYVLSAYFK